MFIMIFIMSLRPAVVVWFLVMRSYFTNPEEYEDYKKKLEGKLEGNTGSKKRCLGDK